MISPELLISFITAADTGSFSAAARQLGKRQGTISNNIARLEDELGITLFDRTGKYPQISEQGLAIYDSAKLVVESNQRFTINASQLSDDLPITIRVGIDEDLSLTPVQGVIKALRKKYPTLQMELHRATSLALFNKIEKNELDLALTMTLEARSQVYEYKAIGHINYYMVCGSRHPFRKKRSVSNDDLMSTTQVLPLSAKQSKMVLAQMKTSYVTWFSQGFEGVVETILANIGWAMIPIFPTQTLPEGISEFKADFVNTQLKAQYDIIWQKNHALNDIEAFIIQELQKLFGY